MHSSPLPSQQRFVATPKAVPENYFYRDADIGRDTDSNGKRKKKQVSLREKDGNLRGHRKPRYHRIPEL